MIVASLKPNGAKMSDLERQIFSRYDSNMAGSEWTTILTLRATKRDGFSLRLRQTGNDGLAFSSPVYRHLRSGSDIFDAARDALSQAQIEMDDGAQYEIHKSLAEFSESLAEEFAGVPAAIEAEEEAKQQCYDRELAERAKSLEKFRAEIEIRVANIPHDVVRLGGGRSSQSKKELARKSLEDFALEHGALPNERE